MCVNQLHLIKSTFNNVIQGVFAAGLVTVTNRLPYLIFR
jgi:hypothetical protein